MSRYIKILILVLAPILGMAQQYTDSLKKVLKNAHTDSARYSASNGLGEYYVEINGDSALHYLNPALVLAEKNNRHMNKALTLARIAYVLAFKGKYAESLKGFQQALKLAEDPVKKERIWDPNMPWLQRSTPEKNRLTILAAIHLLYSILMAETGDFDQPIGQLKIARAYAKQAGDRTFEGIVIMNLGVTYTETNRLDSALLLLQNAEHIFNQTGYKKYLGGLYGQIGVIYLTRGNDHLALQYFHKGIQVATEQKTLSLIDFNYGALVKYYLAKQQKDSSLYYARKSLNNDHAMNDVNLDRVYDDLYRSYLLTGNTDSIFKYQGLALAARDKAYETTIRSLAEFQKLSFKAQLHAQELEKEKADAQTRTRTYVLLAAIGVFMLLAIIFWRNNRQKQKANHLLSEQKEEIISQRDNLGQALEELRNTQTQLVQREKMASLGELTAGIAHEIQNPLNFVNNFSEVNAEMLEELKAESKKPKAERDEQTEMDIIDDLIANEQKIRQHGKRADGIVKGMLEHSRASSGQKEPTDINKLADEYLRMAYNGYLAKGKSFEAVPIAIGMVTHFDEKLPPVNVVPQDMGRVMANLFNNAFYAVNQKAKAAGSDYKPTIEVSTSTADTHIVISVKDNGSGIPDAIKDKIMQPFFTTKPTGEGTGLGLSLSYDIVVKGHGGTITIDSRENEFTAITVSIPVI